MRKYFQFAALLVVTMLSACSGGTESKEAADTAMEDKPVVRLASVTSRDVDQIEEYTATVEAEAKNNIAPTSPGRIDRIFVEVGDHVSKGQKLVQMDAANLKQMKLQLENEETEFISGLSTNSLRNGLSNTSANLPVLRSSSWR